MVHSDAIRPALRIGKKVAKYSRIAIYWQASESKAHAYVCTVDYRLLFDWWTATVLST